MNDRQITIANGFLKVLEKHGGTQNIDIVMNELEAVGIDIEENPLDFEVVERYLLRNKIIEAIPPDNYFYNTLENISEVLTTGVIEFVKHREEAKRQTQITGQNILMNNGANSQGNIYHSSSSGKNTPRRDQIAQKVITPTIYGIASKWFWWIMAIIGTVIATIICSEFID